MQKIILLFISLFLLIVPVNANPISKIISSSHINSGAVSVSVVNVSTGETVLSLNAQTPRNPASTLKLITSIAAFDTLGEEYKFSTKLFKTPNNELYLKLGADPLLSSSDLNQLMSLAKSKNIIEPKAIYIDNTIIDNIEWGEGWQWDDDLNPLMPKFSAYNLDSNLLNIEITPIDNNRAPSISTKPYYPVTFMNSLTTKFKANNSIKIERNNSIAPNIINLSGIVGSRAIAQIPVNNSQVYFNLRLEDAIKYVKIEYYKPIYISTLPKTIYFVGEVTHNIQDIMNQILKNSNNLFAETTYKVAGGKFANSTGTNANSSDMLTTFLNKLNIMSNDVKIVDGSGVSKNNIITANFMTDFLVKLSKEKNFDTIKGFMASPGEGTMRDRMLYFKENLKAKTGTLTDTSAIAGYIISRNGEMYAFDIMIHDPRTSNADKKNIEEQILRYIYTN